MGSSIFINNLYRNKRSTYLCIFLFIKSCLGMFNPAFCSQPFHHADIGIDWHQTSLAHKFSDYQGSMWGLYLQYEYIRNGHLYLGANFYWSHGNISDHLDSCINDLDTQARIGWTCYKNICRYALFFTPYIGYGYRKIDRELDIQIKIKRKNLRFYLPIGLRTSLQLSKCWELVLNVQGRYSTYSFTEGNNKNVYFSRTNKWGLLAELPIIYHFSPDNCVGVDIKLVPYLKYDYFGKLKNIPIDRSFDYKQTGIMLIGGYRF